MNQPPNLSILARMVLLVAITLLAALAAMLFVTFRGPPPHTRPLMIPEIADLARTGTIRTTEWRIEAQRWTDRPAPMPDMRDATRHAGLIAQAMAKSGTDIVFFTEGGPKGPLPMPPPSPGVIGADKGPAAFRPPGPPPPGGTLVRGSFLVAWKDGGTWRGYTGVQLSSRRWYMLTGSIMAGIFILLLLPAYFIARRITRPLRRLADGVQESSGQHAARLPVEGPPEVQQLGTAFNAMQQRLIGHVEERTAMLVAIAHDLRTPLTRLAFRLEVLPDKDRAKAQADLQEMRAMVTTVLDFVRSDAAPITPVRMDLSALVDAIASEQLDMGHDVILGQVDRAIVMGDGAALRRCLGNIIDNALRYGRSAEIALQVTQGVANVVVDDRGPGVAPELIDRLVDPFFRGEQSRNRETGGVGLGLSIALKIAEQHGGAIALENRDGGGLRVKLTLPLARQ